MGGFPDVEQAKQEAWAGRPKLACTRIDQLQRLVSTLESTIDTLREALNGERNAAERLRAEVKSLQSEVKAREAERDAEKSARGNAEHTLAHERELFKATREKLAVAERNIAERG